MNCIYKKMPSEIIEDELKKENQEQTRIITILRERLTKFSLWAEGHDKDVYDEINKLLSISYGKDPTKLTSELYYYLE